MHTALVRFAVVNLLLFVPLFTANKKTCLLVNCVGPNDLSVSVFFNMHTVSRSATKLSIAAFMGLHSHAKLPCLVNLDHRI